MNNSIVYTYTRLSKKTRMSKNMLEIARINQEARDHGMTYGSYLAGTDPIIARKHERPTLYHAVQKCNKLS